MVGNKIHVVVNQKGESTRRRMETHRVRGGCDLKFYVNKPFSSSHLKQYKTNTNYGTSISALSRIRGHQKWWPVEIT